MAKADRGVNSRCYNESMFPRAMFATLIVCMTATLLAQESSELDNVLVWYDFESDGIETGPYTLWVDFFRGGHRAVKHASNTLAASACTYPVRPAKNSHGPVAPSPVGA